MSSKVNQDRLLRVVDSLDQVAQDIKQEIYDMSLKLDKFEIIRLFNQQAFDLFTIMATITSKLNKEKDYKVGGYRILFENALKINLEAPIDKFTLLILEHAAEIYDENEESFLKMTIPDANIKVGNEFSIIRCEKFKELWKLMDNNDKEILKNNVINLTMYAHAFLYKKISGTK